MASDDRRRGRLDQPRAERRRLPRPQVDSDAFGRWSEGVARYFGTARYLAIQTVLVVIWVIYNGVLTYRWHHGEASKPFDPYPFILLNLAFSLQAAYAAPFILLAQNRQANRDRVQAEADRARFERNIADTEYLTREVAALRIALGDVATRDFLRSELQRLFDELREADGRQSAPDRRPA